MFLNNLAAQGWMMAGSEEKKRQKSKKKIQKVTTTQRRVCYCDVRAVLHSCDVFCFVSNARNLHVFPLFPPTSILSLELLCLPLFSSFFLLQCPDQHIPRITLSPFLLQLPLISHWKYIDFFLNKVSDLNSKGLLIQVLIWQREERGRSLNSSKSGSRDIKVIILSFIFFLQNTFSREKIQRKKSYC